MTPVISIGLRIGATQGLFERFLNLPPVPSTFPGLEAFPFDESRFLLPQQITDTWVIGAEPPLLVRWFQSPVTFYGGVQREWGNDPLTIIPLAALEPHDSLQRQRLGLERQIECLMERFGKVESGLPEDSRADYHREFEEIINRLTPVRFNFLKN